MAGWARIKPDEPAIVFEGAPRSWRDLDVRASWIGGALTGAGVRPGDRVACLIGNRTEYVEAFIGALRAGAIFVPLNTLATPAELVTLIEDCGAGVLVTDEVHAGTAVALATALTVVSIDGQLPPAGYAAHPGVPRTGSDPMCIYYTSGTTGRPKGAVISYDNTHYATLNWLIDLGFWQDDRFLLNLPLCFTGAVEA